MHISDVIQEFCATTVSLDLGFFQMLNGAFCSLLATSDLLVTILSFFVLRSYHFDGTSRRFFEGWYFQVAIPEAKQSFAWMYTSENPGAEVRGEGEVVEGSPTSRSSGAAQVMGADEEYLYKDAMTLQNFWGG